MLSKIVQESVESTSNKLANLIISGIKGENIDSRLKVRWNGETKKDIDNILISYRISLLEAVKKEVETYKSYYNPVGDERNKGKHIAMADLSTYLQDQITKCKELMK